MTTDWVDTQPNDVQPPSDNNSNNNNLPLTTKAVTTDGQRTVKPSSSLPWTVQASSDNHLIILHFTRSGPSATELVTPNPACSHCC